ncbi:MAG: L-serine ammonia-lyase, iron-sulfur-dependent, subunit alpha [Bacteroidales bacterium]|jgi:L-serine dehydratase|nr:serine dehydratase [Bacteroidales bacterium]HPX59549.1 L-serine ammonia-lyase, iron-sulfur-dependent, subunit alpha [Bacteroidales bacterium]HQB20447.1 L-serine ammonia-lyase, iron-sulfur-dependent, subunit alpha [Bacteroidales bacterium]
METIRKIYRIGNGPSSSHTMAPRKAALQFKEKHKGINNYRVTLYGSLAATGKGHFTDKAIIEALTPAKVEIIWKPEVFLTFHNNAMMFEALNDSGEVKDQWTIYSVGGGQLANETTHLTQENIYELSFITDILNYIEAKGMTYWEYVKQYEDDDIWDYLNEVWKVMQEAIERGVQNEGVIPGGLFLRRKAASYFVKASSYKASLQGRCLVIAYALATAEENAAGGKIVTAPTCGSSGVLPAVLYHLRKNHNFTDKNILRALASAALFGNVVKKNASISGAEVGCQGEIGTACSMAAVAANQLFGGSPQQIEYAAEMAMENHLGLTCDPIYGLVQIPCIERTAFAALRALDANLFAMMSDGKHIVSFDKVVKTMKLTGKDIPSLYKETALGGLALLR